MDDDDETTSMTVKDVMELLKSILKDLNMDIETYTDALCISQKGQNIILKHDVKDIFINACNRDILVLWQGNIDLQYAVDEYSTVMDVCS